MLGTYQSGFRGVSFAKGGSANRGREREWTPRSNPFSHDDCRASDAAGNTSSASFDVVVVFSAPTGASFFLDPIHGDGSVARLGRAIPVKFRLTGPSSSIGDLRAVLLVAPVRQGNVGACQEARPTAGRGNVFRFDPGSRTYQLVMSTRPLFHGTWQLKVDLGDGVVHTVGIVMRD